MKHVQFHIGLDETGHRYCRLRSVAELRRARERQRLQPKVVLVIASGQTVWRNGLHRRRWVALLEQSRGDRCCFLMTLKRPPLVRPIRPF